MSEWSLGKVYDFMGRPVRYDYFGDGPPLVILHGTPWSSFNMRHLIAALSETYRIYAYDLIGYGQSDKTAGDVSLGIQNELLAQLLEHWHLKRPFIIGHDFGGATLLRTHLLNKIDFERIVLIDPVALSPWGSAFFQHVRAHQAAFAGVPDYIHEAIVRAYVKTAATLSLDESTLNAIVKPWLGDKGKAAFYRQIAQADAAYTDEVQPLYTQISRPVLILWGGADAWIPLDQGRRLQQLIPNAALQVIPDSGHLVIEEKPEDLVDHIRRFLAS